MEKITDQEIEQRIEKLRCDNWKVQHLLTDVGQFHTWNEQLQKSLFKILHIKKIFNDKTGSVYYIEQN